MKTYYTSFIAQSGGEASNHLSNWIDRNGDVVVTAMSESHPPHQNHKINVVFQRVTDSEIKAKKYKRI